MRLTWKRFVLGAGRGRGLHGVSVQSEWRVKPADRALPGSLFRCLTACFHLLHIPQSCAALTHRKLRYRQTGNMISINASLKITHHCFRLQFSLTDQIHQSSEHPSLSVVQKVCFKIKSEKMRLSRKTSEVSFKIKAQLRSPNFPAFSSNVKINQDLEFKIYTFIPKNEKI